MDYASPVQNITITYSHYYFAKKKKTKNVFYFLTIVWYERKYFLNLNFELFSKMYQLKKTTIWNKTIIIFLLSLIIQSTPSTQSHTKW